MTALTCIECAETADERAAGWEGRLVDLDDDGEDEIVFYCPVCAEHEFGDQAPSAGQDAA